jgi:hypothetical protein
MTKKELFIFTILTGVLSCASVSYAAITLVDIFSRIVDRVEPAQDANAKQMRNILIRMYNNLPSRNQTALANTFSKKFNANIVTLQNDTKLKMEMMENMIKNDPALNKLYQDLLACGQEQGKTAEEMRNALFNLPIK